MLVVRHPLGIGNPFPYMPKGPKLSKKYAKVAEQFGKTFSLTRGLRKPQKEELIGPFSLPDILEEG